MVSIWLPPLLRHAFCARADNVHLSVRRHGFRKLHSLQCIPIDKNVGGQSGATQGKRVDSLTVHLKE